MIDDRESYKATVTQHQILLNKSQENIAVSALETSLMKLGLDTSLRNDPEALLVKFPRKHSAADDPEVVYHAYQLHNLTEFEFAV